VSQLHTDVTEQELRDVFSAAAPPTGVRRTVGKKFAFVEFADADAVQRAIALTGTVVREQAIRVQRSDPSLAEKPAKSAVEPQNAASVRKPTLLLPRSMAINKTTTVGAASAATAGAETKPKSNADFRKFLN
jgi:RNA recognition motif-containing protein